MHSAIRKLAIVALGATALTAISLSQSAHASNVSIGGSPLVVGPTPLYGSATYENNVTNSPGGPPATGSILVDPTGPLLTASTPLVQNGQVIANNGGNGYLVNWYFTGSESGFNISLNAPSTGPSPAVTFTEGNQNNSAYGGGGPPLTSGSYQFLGTTNESASIIPFTLSWSGGSVDNSATQVTPGTAFVASMVFSYVDISTYISSGLITLTTTPTDWFAFFLNDNGGPDDNHDDFVGFAQVVLTGREPPLTTPIPAALPLFGSVLGGGFVFGKWRKRRKATVQPTAA